MRYPALSWRVSRELLVAPAIWHRSAPLSSVAPRILASPLPPTDAPPSSALPGTPALAPRPSLEPAVVEAIHQTSLDGDGHSLLAETLLQHSMRTVKTFTMIFAKADDSRRKELAQVYTQWLLKTGRINDNSVLVRESLRRSSRFWCLELRHRPRLLRDRVARHRLRARSAPAATLLRHCATLRVASPFLSCTSHS